MEEHGNLEYAFTGGVVGIIMGMRRSLLSKSFNFLMPAQHITFATK